VTNAYILADLARELTRLGHDLRVLTTTPHYNLVADDLRRQPMTHVKGQWLLQSDCERAGGSARRRSRGDSMIAHLDDASSKMGW